MRRTTIRLLLLIPLLLSCNRDIVREADAPDADPDAAPPPPTAQHPDMPRHFAQAVAMREAVILGKPADAVAPASWLADHASDDLPPTWKPHVGTVQAAAQLGKTARDIPTAAEATSRLAVACGHCHTALSITVHLTHPPMPSLEVDPKGHMQRHAWAVERLWEGLIAPNDEAWSAGVAALGEPPLGVEDDPDVLPPGQEHLAEKVHTLGKTAAEATTPAARSAAFAELIGTCGACHAAMKKPVR